jgi:hypothetical protein
MLKTLLASGALLQGVKAEMSAKAQRFGMVLVCGVIAVVFMGVGLAAIAVAAAIALTPTLGAAGAAGAVGGTALVIAGIIVYAATRPPAAPAAAAPVSPLTSQYQGPAAGINAALPGIASAASAAPLPWMIGALVLGVVLGSRR